MRKNYFKFVHFDYKFQGINPQSLIGTETGVYIGFTSLGMPDGVPEEIQEDFTTSMRDSFLSYTGNGKTMYANRISFVFDFKGPSMVIDTACSSSMVALDVAITDLRLGKLLKVYFLININVLNACIKKI